MPYGQKIERDAAECLLVWDFSLYIYAGAVFGSGRFYLDGDLWGTTAVRIIGIGTHGGTRFYTNTSAVRNQTEKHNQTCMCELKSRTLNKALVAQWLSH